MTAVPCSGRGLVEDVMTGASHHSEPSHPERPQCLAQGPNVECRDLRKPAVGLSRGGSSEQHGAGGTRGGLGADVKSEQAAKAEVESGAGSNQRRRRHITCGHASKALWDIKMCMFLNNLSLRLKCSKAFHFQRSRFFLKPCVIFP